jgi:hypothetical protein
MANPVTVTCSAGVWTRVALNVTAGGVKRINKAPNLYLETYRMTGGAAPTDQAEGVEIFTQGPAEIIAAAHAIDVYVMAVGRDGAVRVDLP